MSDEEKRYYEFQVGGGMTVDERHKPQWPHNLCVWLNKTKAWNVIESLQKQLRDEDTDEAGDIQLFFSGKLK